MSSKNEKGVVYLVGSGPGDPGLITIKGQQCLQRADVVVYDHLADASLWKNLSPKTRLIDAGKKRGSHQLTQDRISKLLVSEARKGKVVVRLKGGDPVVFGRVGEEALELSKAGVRFEIVPGVSSVMAAASYAGIPLTHRDFTRDFVVLTGHENPYSPQQKINWQAIAQVGTIVILMGSHFLAENLNRLIESGKLPSTPAAAIQWGTCPRQKTVTGTLSDLAIKVKQAGLSHPMLTIVGEVVSLRDKMNWFENRPLFGQRIVVTRARDQSSTLVRQLTELGADVLEFPTIEIVPPTSWRPIDAVLKKVAGYDGIAFTSTNSVEYFFERATHYGFDARLLAGLKIASIGGATSEKLRSYGLHPDIEPSSSQGKYLAQAILKNKAIKKIIFPQSKIGSDDFIQILNKAGVEVKRVVAYENRIPQNAKLQLKKLLEFDPHWLTFASSSSVENFVKLVSSYSGKKSSLHFHFQAQPDSASTAMPPESFVKKCKVAVIGPVTAKAARIAGFDICAESSKADISAMVKAICLSQ